ncbi:battenin isoform X3 [Exaiptasia diaphana]|nr:battenin isoform X3 [Exaiptasia diaphana]
MGKQHFAKWNGDDIFLFHNIVYHFLGERIVSKNANKRNLFGFWLLGLCNNFAYVVMLSAAHDILGQSKTENKEGKNDTESIAYSLYSNSSGNATNGNNNSLGCNPLSTGTILLADILPTLLIKLTAPFYMNRLNYHLRVGSCILFAFASFFLVAFSNVLWVSLLGVVCASISGGFGEITILSFSAHFDKNVVSTWSSGTGAAGLFGALSYAGLISAGLTPKITVLVMNIVPFLMGVSFWYILEYPTHLQNSWKSLYSPDYSDYHQEHTAIISESSREDHAEQTTESFTLVEKLAVVKSLLKYMVPLALVYFAEYFINQGLHELIFFKGIWITPAEQYRW